MSEAKEPRTAKPGSLLSQWWTLGAIALDARTAGRHMTVAWVIIDRYMQSKGGSRASLRYIEKATGLSKPTVIGACRELVDWGYFTRHLGEGTRPSEYGPNWLVVNPSLPQASGQQGFTTGGKDGLTTTEPSGQQGFTKNLLTSPADKPADSKVGTEDTPDPVALGLAAGAGSRDPESAFDRFWSAYPRKFQKPKARAAWDKIEPDAELAARIIEAAAAWAEHYATQGTDKKWIPTPANWLGGERYDEDLPEVYVDAKEAAIAKKVSSKAPRATEPEPETASEWLDEISPFVTPGRHIITVVAAKERATELGRKLQLSFDVDLPKQKLTDVPFELYTEHVIKAVQDDGQAALKVLAGGDDIEKAIDLVGRQCRIFVSQVGAVKFEPLVHSVVPGLMDRIRAAQAARAA
ncbi:hypothetical protein [Mesorhizobium sp. M1E.F.Ca.ET.063.01.1.1]|uniref:hypothetical protein n=1 Tax=Mesorhizobium sp. M1E.F.Ca.ET.063.01.1.1 TaxID=2496750 RepID=UPI000FCC2708|nr:hypothetical protein [Mesorhizobium sp. M1E.F.Ca.ET.063.01.1.1]RUW76944.1 hypothetical protein EOA29_27105 [Mesorhizobium sp. M1E.F.Ca.ET.063.01.1.1]